MPSAPSTASRDWKSAYFCAGLLLQFASTTILPGLDLFEAVEAEDDDAVRRRASERRRLVEATGNVLAAMIGDLLLRLL